MAEYRLNDDAKTDIIRIYQYGVNQFGDVQANTYLGGLFDCFEAIAEHPLQYPQVDSIREGYRRSVFGTDSIYYRLIDEETVEIMAVIGRQDIGTWL